MSELIKLFTDTIENQDKVRNELFRMIIIDILGNNFDDIDNKIKVLLDVEFSYSKFKEPNNVEESDDESDEESDDESDDESDPIITIKITYLDFNGIQNHEIKTSCHFDSYGYYFDKNRVKSFCNECHSTNNITDDIDYILDFNRSFYKYPIKKPQELNEHQYDNNPDIYVGYLDMYLDKWYKNLLINNELKYILCQYGHYSGVMFSNNKTDILKFSDYKNITIVNTHIYDSYTYFTTKDIENKINKKYSEFYNKLFKRANNIYKSVRSGILESNYGKKYVN